MDTTVREAELGDSKSAQAASTANQNRYCPTCGDVYLLGETACAKDQTALVRCEEVDPLIGEVIASTFKLTRPLARGAMGQLYEAEHVRLGRKFAVKVLAEVAQEVLCQAGMDSAALDWLIPHQANIRIIQATAKRLEMPMEKVVLTVQDHGNTSAASVPMALDVAVRDGRIKRGDLLLLEGFGGGFTWGSSLIRF